MALNIPQAIEQPAGGGLLPEILVRAEAQLAEYVSEFEATNIVDPETFALAVAQMQAEFDLYNSIKRDELLPDSGLAEFSPAVRQVITQLFAALKAQLSVLHSAMAEQPALLQSAMENPKQALAMWLLIVDVANLAARALLPELEQDFWQISDQWLLAMHKEFKFEPGLALDGQKQALPLPVVIDWEALARGDNYFRPYWRALSHRDFEYIDDTNAVDFQIESGAVIAITAGEIVLRELDSDEGGANKENINKDNKIFVKAADGTVYAYRHLAKLPLGHPLRDLTQVQAGQSLGPTAMTGLTTENHLHFGVYHTVANGKLISIPVQIVALPANSSDSTIS